MYRSYQEGSAYLQTRDGEAECEKFFGKIKAEWKADPNNIPFKFVEDIKKTTVLEPAEFKIFKRRQLTKMGDADPASPCDDKGLPLYIDDKGNIVTKANGNEIAWGEWKDTGNVDVSMETIRPGKYCRSQRLRRVGWGKWPPDSEETALRYINRDKEQHDKQQEDRVSKVNVEYKIEKVKDETEHDEWTCIMKKEKARDFPDDWKSTKFTSPDPKVDLMSDPIHIAFSIRKLSKKTGLPTAATTGVGTFKGRQTVTSDLARGNIFGMYALEDAANKAGFSRQHSFGSYNPYKLPVPGTTDECRISTSYVSFPYYSGGRDRMRLMSKDGKISIGGSFVNARFFIVLKDKDKPYSGETEYKEKAPGSTVDFCHEKFTEIARKSVVVLDQP